ncbi:LysR family transcriptional regulator [Mycobacterium sp. MYCO198283]|uniref:LysR substrate-binding domain-containing protein n=1 Tax=Mycobacterium sp. MYCO198283 TaxID=2883505 RepID=UPI001E28D666|nr:LysR family transcriptional regulator [Mycobacterium sp. MYCO198283]MCG5434286.1 LysR family transcriptional regulator [Mycobacterium sp. MYCO198283]
MVNVQIRDLRYFLAVADELHFTRAAEALAVSQPALSKQLRALETVLGASLFARNQRTVQLTELGAALLPHARAIVAEWEAAAGTIARLVPDASRTLTVGIGATPAAELWERVAAAVARRAPDLALRVRTVPATDPAGGLADPHSGIDAALVWLPIPDERRFAWQPVASWPRGVALPAGHRLADRESIAFQELLDEPFIAMPAVAGTLRDFWLAREHRGGRAMRIAGEAATVAELQQAVADGVGIALVLADEPLMATYPGVVVRAVTGVGPAQLALAWRRGDDRDPVTLLRATVSEIAPG